MQIFGGWKVENRKIRIDRTAALIRNHAERRAGNYIALKLPRKKNTKNYQESKRRQKCRRKEQRRRNKGEGTKGAGYSIRLPVIS